MANPAWTIEVDSEACIGSGMCVAVAPEHFVVENGRSRPMTAHAQPADELRDATALCPAAAVLIRDEAGRLVD